MGLRLASLLAIVAIAQLGVSQSTPTPLRTGMIVGQVIDGATGQPVSDALVTMSRSGDPSGRVMADEEGRFFFTELPAGDYFIQARKEGYAPGQYGQRSSPHGSFLRNRVGQTPLLREPPAAPALRSAAAPR